MNAYDQMRQAISEASDTLKAADNAASSLAIMLKGRLRKGVPTYVLVALKRELSEFNARTEEWKS